LRCYDKETHHLPSFTIKPSPVLSEPRRAMLAPRVVHLNRYCDGDGRRRHLHDAKETGTITVRRYDGRWWSGL
jgi:hypothetical protein